MLITRSENMVPVERTLVISKSKKTTLTTNHLPILWIRIDGKTTRYSAMSGKKPFDYIVIPDSSRVSETYKVDSAPLHVIINKQGEIETVLNGAIGNRDQYFKQIINRLLDMDK